MRYAILCIVLLSGCAHVMSGREIAATCQAQYPASDAEYGYCLSDMHAEANAARQSNCLLYTSPSPRD